MKKQGNTYHFFKKREERFIEKLDRVAKTAKADTLSIRINHKIIRRVTI